jgi:hypothetical protein
MVVVSLLCELVVLGIILLLFVMRMENTSLMLLVI